MDAIHEIKTVFRKDFERNGSEKTDPDLSLDQYLKQDPAYQNISKEEIAKDLGFFTQVERRLGFPYHPYKPAENGSSRKAISDQEAYQRLLQGKPIELVPMRTVSINFSAGELQSVASLVNPISAVANAAAAASSANFGVQTLSREVNNGKPIFIPNASYLKLLYQLHTQDFPKETGGEVAKAAQSLSYFTAKAKMTNHPWSFYSPDKKTWPTIKAVIKDFGKGGVKAGIAGAAAGALIGGPIGALLGIHLASFFVAALYGGAAGFAGGGAYGAAQPVKTKNGEEYDELTALDLLLRKQPVNFQQQGLHTFNLPFFGNFGWKTNYGVPSTIKNTDELADFSKMESAATPDSLKNKI
jgi:hypothetical protein